MEKLSLDQAKEEFLKWFEAKKLPERLLEKKTDDHDAIIDAFMEGNLILNEDLTLTQVLKFPKDDIIELEYKFRITEGELAAALKGIKIDDLIGQMPIAYIAALTGQVRGKIRMLDSVDLNVGKAISSFFTN